MEAVEGHRCSVIVSSGGIELSKLLRLELLIEDLEVMDANLVHLTLYLEVLERSRLLLHGLDLALYLIHVGVLAEAQSSLLALLDHLVLLSFWNILKHILFLGVRLATALVPLFAIGGHRLVDSHQALVLGHIFLVEVNELRKLLLVWSASVH